MGQRTVVASRAERRGDVRLEPLSNHGRSRVSGSSSSLLCRALPPLLWSIIAHGLLLIAMALAKFQWRSEPPKLLTISAGVAEEALDELPTIEALPPESQAQLKPHNPPRPVQAAPLASPEFPAGSLSAPKTALAMPTAAGPLEAIGDVGGADLARPLASLERRQTERGAVFFGLGAAGNSFCFVVDSSRSMRGGKFDLARREVLRAVAAMQPSQRFYVMLFDHNVEPMELELGSPSERPAKATLDNKQRLARWIATTKMEPSARPAEAIEAALSLRTDVLFLLTDGELPAELVQTVRAQNLVRAEGPGPQKPQVIIHTVGLYSQRGRELLYQLASENGGRYRFIPRPPK